MDENNVWLERWKKREIGFDQGEVNSFMMKYFSSLKLKEGSRIFVPLCGKTIDIAWLLEQGYEVVGVELSEQAIVELFDAMNVVPSITSVGEHVMYTSQGITLYVGDIFQLTPQILGQIDAIYDRASLVALTMNLREKYTKHLRMITNNAIQFLLCFEYDQSSMNGPPYCVDADEVHKHYAEYYRLKLLCKENIVGGFKGKIPAFDVLWLLS